MSGLLATLLMAVGLMKVYVEDVFSAYTYTGNASTTSHVVGFQPDLVWGKSRANAIGHYLVDSARGRDKYLYTELTNAQATGSTAGNDLASFDATGFTLGPNQSTALNSNNQTKVAWCFRKAPKFFDVVTWTGNGSAGRTIAHALDQAPGMIIVKQTSGTQNWCVWHRLSNGGANGNGWLYLNGINGVVGAGTAEDRWGTGSGGIYVAPTSTQFTVGADDNVNGNGSTYVAYLFAHDTGTDGLIQCGTFSTSGGGATRTQLGWEPQCVMWKKTNSTGDWYMLDTARGFTALGGDTSGDRTLSLNKSNAEGSGNLWGGPDATGFTIYGISGSEDHVYMAIRAPMKVPTDATKVFKTIARTGTGSAATVTGAGFAPDVLLGQSRGGNSPCWYSRLRGATTNLDSSNSNAEGSNTATGVLSIDMDGFTMGGNSGLINTSAVNYANHFFKRAPGFMQEVCYTGTGSAKTEAHGLGVAPELWISKSRSATNRWVIGCSYLPTPASDFLELSTSTKGNDTTTWNNTVPTASVFSVGTGTDANSSGVTYDMLLFATCPGVSKVGGYIGTGTTLQIDCGFAAGARFVLIKRTTVATGDWYLWDSVRGIVSGNDPYLLLNSAAAEVTSTDYIDPYSPGFEISSTAPSAINASGGTFIFLAIA